MGTCHWAHWKRRPVTEAERTGGSFHDAEAGELADQMVHTAFGPSKAALADRSHNDHWIGCMDMNGVMASNARLIMADLAADRSSFDLWGEGRELVSG